MIMLDGIRENIGGTIYYIMSRWCFWLFYYTVYVYTIIIIIIINTA